MRKKPIGFFGGIICLILITGCDQQKSSTARTFATHWSVKPSLKYDVCHLVGIMTGRPLYEKFYPEITQTWARNLPAPVKASIANIDKLLGPEWPPGPRLSLLMAAVPADDSLNAILQAIQNNAQIYDRLMQSDYGSPRNWKQWVDLKPHVQTVLQYLIDKNFEEYWRSNLLPKITADVAVIQQDLQGYDVVGEIQNFLVDYQCPDTIDIYLLALAQPHELRISSQQRATDIKNPLKATIRSFYQEILHPYCDRLIDSTLAADFSNLQSDAFLLNTYSPVAANGGQENLSAYFKKELVIAAELWLSARRQLLTAQTNLQAEETGELVRQYLRTKDNGIHVLAAVIYSYLESGLKLDRLSYADFIKDLFASGRLKPGKIESRYRDFMNRPAVGSD